MAAPKGENEVYKPAEACRIAEVAPYVLRYWETEFAALSEGRDKGASKLYTARDVRIIGRIRELLYDEGFTVAGAKKRLDAEIAEGRFDAGLAPAPPLASQRGAEKPKTVAPSPPPAIQSPAPSMAGKTAAAKAPAPPVVAVSPPAASAASKPPASVAPPSKAADAGFDRKMVLRELKDIVRILGRS